VKDLRRRSRGRESKTAPGAVEGVLTDCPRCLMGTSGEGGGTDGDDAGRAGGTRRLRSSSRLRPAATMPLYVLSVPSYRTLLGGPLFRFCLS
jgi:hypothetical protein